MHINTSDRKPLCRAFEKCRSFFKKIYKILLKKNPKTNPDRPWTTIKFYCKKKTNLWGKEEKNIIDNEKIRVVVNILLLIL